MSSNNSNSKVVKPSGNNNNNNNNHGIVKDFQDSFNTTLQYYWKQHSEDHRLRLIDIMCLFMVLVAILESLFMIIIRDNFPFNAFLAGFIICVGQFVLLISLRLQLVDKFDGIGKNRAFGEFIIASLVLHFITLHFIN